MIEPELLQKGQELGVLDIDEPGDRVAYRLGSEREYSWSDPEEQVRAETILSLIFSYSYSPNRILTEVPVPNRKPNNWADVVVFRDDRRRSPYITVETGARISSSERTQKIEQLFGYANALASEFAVYKDSSGPKQCWQIRGAGGLERIRNIVGDIPQNYGETPEYIFYRGGENDLEIVDSNVLSRIFDQCHQELWSGGRLDPTEAFDEMSKLMFAKLFDEQRTPNGEPYGFQWGNKQTDIMVAERVIERYQKARERDRGVFTEEIRSEPRKIANVVRYLQRISLSRTDPDAKGRAYEQFLGEVFRGKLGQYFTRREIVDFLVGLCQPTYDDILLDPACGSGGFLVNSMKEVFQHVDRDFAGDETQIVRLKDEFAKNHIFGLEINERIARVAMMDMVINEDGHSNVEVRTAFDSDFGNQSIENEAFSLILTNPPFGDKVRIDDRDKLGKSELADYALSQQKKSTKSEVLFIERCNQFLREGGRLGIVIPDGLLSNPSDKHVRTYLLHNFHIQAIVSLPSFAFRKAGSGMKTSLLLARKWNKGEHRGQDYPIFMAIVDKIGYDATARPDDNHLPRVLAHFQNSTGSLEDKVIRVSRTELTGNLRLDPVYHYLGPIIERELESLSYPIYTLQEVVGETIQSGKSPKGGAKYSIGSVPIILVGNIVPDGTIDLQDVNFVEEDFYETNREKASAHPLDILVAKDGATTGKVGLVPQEFEYEKCLINEHIFRFSVPSTLPGDDSTSCEIDAEEQRKTNTWFLFFFLKSPLGQMQITREISGGAQGGITKKFVENIRVPVPAFDERNKFVKASQSEYRKYIDLASQAKDQLQRFNRSLGLNVLQM